MLHRISVPWWVFASTATACAGARTANPPPALEAYRASAVFAESEPRELAEAEDFELRGGLADFVVEALRHSPQLEAAYAEWRAQVESAPVAARPPEPELSYAGFVRAVETRVGPQRHRLSLRQALPWPGLLAASRDAREAEADVAARAFLAQLSKVVRDVAEAYWWLWLVEQSHAIRLDHEILLEGLIGTVQARVETGEKPIAELLQVQLRLQHLRDHRSRHEAEARRLESRLLEVVGLSPAGSAVIERQAPSAELPAETAGTLRARAVEHPRVARWSAAEDASRAQARAARERRWPGLRFGADYIVTGEAPSEGVPDSGKDPIVLSLGLSLPVWLDAYAHERRAAEAKASAARASRRGEALRIAAELEAVLARLGETHERIARYSGTLLPQADALYETVVGAYEVGRAGVSEVLLALEEQLELRLELAEARAEHAVAWAELDELTGRSLDRWETTP